MNRIFELWRDTRHLWILLFLVVAGGAISWKMRERMVPESYGQAGPYRAAALGPVTSISVS